VEAHTATIVPIPLSLARASSALREEEDARADAGGDGRDRLSRSLMRGLVLLAAFEPGGRDRGIVELAGELGFSPSTAHRYARTLVALGVLEHSPVTRRYRLTAAPA
jgi:hypothetical protein